MSILECILSAICLKYPRYKKNTRISLDLNWTVDILGVFDTGLFCNSYSSSIFVSTTLLDSSMKGPLKKRVYLHLWAGKHTTPNLETYGLNETTINLEIICNCIRLTLNIICTMTKKTPGHNQHIHTEQIELHILRTILAFIPTHAVNHFPRQDTSWSPCWRRWAEQWRNDGGEHMRTIFEYPKNPDPSKIAILRTRTRAIQVQTLPLEGPRILWVRHFIVGQWHPIVITLPVSRSNAAMGTLLWRGMGHCYNQFLTMKQKVLKCKNPQIQNIYTTPKIWQIDTPLNWWALGENVFFGFKHGIIFGFRHAKFGRVGPWAKHKVPLSTVIIFTLKIRLCVLRIQD